MKQEVVCYRHSFKKKIKKFCKKYDIKIKSYIYYGGGGNKDYYILYAKPENLFILKRYISMLESIRAKKNIFYKLFN